MKLLLSPSQQNGIEENLIRPIAEHLYSILKDDNLIDVELIPYFTGTDEEALLSAIQWENSNTTGADRILALHADAGQYARGASGLYFSDNGRKFITPITQAIMDLTPWPDVGIRQRTDLGELKRTAAVAGLLEISFYDNPEELAWMKANTELIAQTIKKGIYTALGVQVPIVDFKKKFNDLVGDINSLINKYKGA